jgi:hypothetical protein
MLGVLDAWLRLCSGRAFISWFSRLILRQTEYDADELVCRLLTMTRFSDSSSPRTVPWTSCA